MYRLKAGYFTQKSILEVVGIPSKFSHSLLHQ